MATEKLYYVNQYQKTGTAVVRRCEEIKGGWAVVLDRTIFYPTGGGQPCDLGTLDGVSVLDVSDRDGEACRPNRRHGDRLGTPLHAHAAAQRRASGLWHRPRPFRL